MTNTVVVQLAHIASDVINPLLALAWCGCVAISMRRGDRDVGRYVASTLVGALVCFGSVHLIRSAHLFAAYPMFPSGHEAFGASVATSIAMRFRGIIGIAGIVAALLLASALVVAGYHQWMDVSASLLVCPVVTVVCHVAVRKSFPRAT